MDEHALELVLDASGRRYRCALAKVLEKDLVLLELELL